MPAQIVREVFRRHPAEPKHPVLKAAVVGIHVVDVHRPLRLVLGVSGNVSDLHARGGGFKAVVGADAVGHQDGVPGKLGGEYGRYVRGSPGRQDGGQRRTDTPLAGDEDRDLLRRQAAFLGLGPPLLWRTAESALLPLERLPEIRLVGLDETLQDLRLLPLQCGQETVPPAKGRVAMDAQCVTRVPDGHPMHHAPGVVEEPVGGVEPREGRPRECVERLATAARLALEPPASPFAATSDDLAATAVGAGFHRLDHFGLDQRLLDGLLPSLHRPPDGGQFVRPEGSDAGRQRQEVFACFLCHCRFFVVFMFHTKQRFEKQWVYVASLLFTDTALINSMTTPSKPP